MRKAFSVGDVSGILKDEWVFDTVDKGDREGIIHKSLCQRRNATKEQGLFTELPIDQFEAKEAKKG